MNAQSNRNIVLYLVLTLGLSSIFYWLIVDAGSMAAGNGLYVLALMWCPGVAAVLTRLLTQRNLRGQGWGLGKPRYLAWAYVFPLLLCVPLYGLVWVTGIGELGVSSFLETFPLENKGGSIWVSIALLASVGVGSSLISGTGEEIGWRGYLVPELAKRASFDKVALISGAVWAAWHYPLLILVDYNSGASTAYSLIMFTLMVLGASYVFAWLRLSSGSLWPAALLHATHNLFIQALFNPLTIDTGYTEYVIGEFGVGLVIAYAIAALLVRRSYLKKTHLKRAAGVATAPA